MINWLVISLLILFLLAYKLFEKDISSPSVLYVGGFLACSIGAFFYREEWGLGLHVITYLVIVGGAVFFMLTEYFSRKLFCFCKKSVDVTSDAVINVKNYKLVLFIGFQLLSYVLLAKYKFSHSIGANTLGEAIGDISQQTKMEHESFYFPWYVQYPYQICRDSGYIWICLFSYYIFKSKRYRLKKWLLGINLAICIVMGGYVSGGRMPFLAYLIPLFVFVYLFNRYKQKWGKKQLQFWTVGLILLASVIFITSFVKVGILMGRQESASASGYVIAIYCGAQIKNLDDFLSSSEKKDNSRFGGYTFSPIYKDLYKKSSQDNYDMSSKFNTYRDYPLGNVYTNYYHYFYDFNFGGFLCVIFMSFCLTYLNCKIHTTKFFKTGELNLLVLLYASFLSSSFLSFFSESFYAKIGIVALIKSLFFWLICKVFLQGFNKKKIMLGSKRIL